MTKKPEISFVIVSYNVKQLLLNCIASLSKKIGISHEVIVVDNNSSDGSRAKVEKQFAEVKWIQNNFNAGFSAANNQGIEASSGRYIFLLNPDTEIADGDIAAVLRALDEAGDTSIIAPRLLNSDGSLQPSCWGFPNGFTVFLETFYLNLLFKQGEYDPGVNAPRPVKAASGAALVFLESFVQKVGGLDKNLFWLEDTDICYRSHKSGGQVIYFPSFTILHHSGQSYRTDFRLPIANQLMSRLKFFRKHGMWVSFLASEILILFQCLSRIVLYALLSPFGIMPKAKLRAYAFALRKYFKYNFAGDQSIS